MLDLAPETESRVMEYAAAAGVSVDELMGRTFPPRPVKPAPDPKALNLIAAIRQWQAEDATDDEDELDQRERDTAAHHASLDRTRQQAGMRPLFPSEAQP